ncbi:MAG: hypothetical protein HYY01_05370 [Chloroflexi bacterium]|nr:hypothetical protein [Chloroflexota bacterium]
MEPGFGGYFRDRNDNGIAYVYLMDVSQQAKVWEIISGLADPSIPIREVRGLQGQFTMGQLTEWYPKFRRAAFAVPGTITTSIQEGRNRLKATVVTESARAAVLAAVAQEGISLDAVIVEIGSPIRPSANLPDGIQVTVTTRN